MRCPQCCRQLWRTVPWLGRTVPWLGRAAQLLGRAGLWLVVLGCSTQTFALEESTVLAVGLRVQKALTSGTSLEATVSARSNEGFISHERKIFDMRASRDIGIFDVSAGYNYQFDRNGQSGTEHRLWQQVRHQFALPASSIDSSARIEERYFTSSFSTGNRLRILNKWNRPLASGNVLRLGYEWVMNLDTISANTRRGVSQNRFIAALQYPLAGGNRLELEYQLRYTHVVGNDNRIQNQIQLQYNLNL